MDIQAPALTEVFSWGEAPLAHFAVISTEASHSLSPSMHNAAFKSRGLPYRYVAINAMRGEVGRALDHLRGLGYLGVNMTLPHKAEAAVWAQRLTRFEYPEVDVVNTVKLESREGFNTDTAGFLRSIGRYGLGAGNACLVLGAGGSALAVTAVLVKLGCEVTVWNRTSSRAEELARRFEARVVACEVPEIERFDIIVNATSAGKHGQSLPLAYSEMRAHQIAYDLFYAKEPTQFLKEAMERGLRTQDGVEMLVYQGAESWRCWGLPKAPIGQMVKVVRDALNR